MQQRLMCRVKRVADGKELQNLLVCLPLLRKSQGLDRIAGTDEIVSGTGDTPKVFIMFPPEIRRATLLATSANSKRCM